MWVKIIANKFRLNAIANYKPKSILACLGVYPGNGLEQEFFVHIKSIVRTGEIYTINTCKNAGGSGEMSLQGSPASITGCAIIFLRR